MASEYTEKVTAERVYEVYRYLYREKASAGMLPAWWHVPSATWEEVSEQEKEMYIEMAYQVEIDLSSNSEGAHE